MAKPSKSRRMPSSLRRVWSPDWIPILSGQAFGVLCGLAGVRLLSTWVPPATLGLYGLCLVLAPAGALLTHHGLARHAARHWPVGGDAHSYYRNLVNAARRASLILFGLLAVVFAFVSTVVDLPYAPVLPWLCLAALAGAYGAILHAILQTSRAYWVDCAVSCANSVARTGGPLAAVLAAGASVPVLLAGFALPQALVLAAAWWWMLGRRLHPPRLPAPDTADTASDEPGHYGRAFWIVGMCTLTGGAMHRGWAAFCLDAEELGYFTLAGNLAFVLPNVLSAALSQFLYPRLFARARHPGAGPTTGWLRPVELTAAFFALASTAGTLTLHFAAPWLIGGLIHPDYAGAIPYLLANGGHAAALALGHFYQLPSIASRRPAAAARAMLGLVIVLAAGGGITAFLSPPAYLAWLALSPIAAGLWLATAARLDARP